MATIVVIHPTFLKDTFINWFAITVCRVFTVPVTMKHCGKNIYIFNCFLINLL